MTVHLAVHHQDRHLGPEEYLSCIRHIPHGAGVGQVRRMTTMLRNIHLTWFMFESAKTHHDAVFLLLDKSMVPDDSEVFKQLAGEAMAFWLHLGVPKQYYAKILEDNSRLITIGVSNADALTELFNTKCTGARHEIQIPETGISVSDSPDLAREPGEGQPDPQPG